VVTTTLAQVVSEQKGKEGYGKIKSILLISAKKLMYIGIIIFIVLVAISPFLKNILNLPSEVPVIILGFSLIFITVLPSPRGVLQGMQEFGSLGFNMATDKPALLLFGVLFTYLGMGINGAILSYGIAALVLLIIALLSLRFLFERESEQVDIPVYKYASPVLVLILCITVMSSIDILFVRKYFSGEVSGYFTAMKMLGEVIYFLALALGGVLLPKVSELETLKVAHGFLLRKTLIYFGILLAAILSAYAFTPELIITILFGKVYSSVAGYLVWYALAMGLLSLAIVFMFYDVSAKRTAFRYPLVIFTLLEIVLLMAFHETIGQIIWILIAVFFILLVSVITINRRYGSYAQDR
jgi:O-antigen/teichoic acid export membrane protein